MTTQDTQWLHTQAGIAAQFDYQDKGQSLAIDSTEVLGQSPTTGRFLMRVLGQATDRGEYWWPVEEYVAIGKKEDGIPTADDPTDEEMAEFVGEEVEFVEEDEGEI